MAANDSLGLLESVARAAAVAVATDDQKNTEYHGLHLVIDVTAVTATPSVVPKIQGKDRVSGKYYDLLVGAAITAEGTTVLKVFPGASPVANAVANDHLPRVWRVVLTHADTDSITYSVAAELFA